MNRTLRRPMFRIGGVAEGITSGLDRTQLTASRPGFLNGKTVDPIEERFLKRRDLLKKYTSPRDTGLSDFLINLGLDLVSRPKSGNIFQQVATSAKGPYEQWSAMKSSRAAGDDKLNAALLGDVMELASEEERAKIKAEGEMGKGTDYAFEKEHAAYKQLIKDQRELEKQKGQLESSLETLPPTLNPSDIQSQIEEIDRKIEDNQKLQKLYSKAQENPMAKIIVAAYEQGEITFQDVIKYLEDGTLPKNFAEEFAQGGRAGYQNAGAVMPGAMQTAAMQAPGPTDQGQDSSVQNLSYEELRSRLPASITDDIIQLIANSQEALVDFANIQTQRDIKSFNQKYQVELVLPQEA